MKQCPKCSRVYADDALNFCLDDGEWLAAPNVSNEPVTAILSGDPPSEAQTVHQATITNPASADTVNAASPQNNSSRLSSFIIAGSLLIAIILISFGAYKYAVARRSASQISFEKAKLLRLTTTGKATSAAISPDGKLVVHVQDDGGQQSLWIRQTATQSNVQILPPSPVAYDSLAFTPDGNFIFYTVSGQQYPQRVLFQISILGGAPKKILEDIEGEPVSFSPTGKQFAFNRNERGIDAAIWIADTDGSDQRNLVTVKNPPDYVGWMSWSPDGQKIAYESLNYDSNDGAVYEVRVADGSTRQLTEQRWLRIFGLVWMFDGNSLLMLATPGQQFSAQIWQVSYPDGEARQLTNDLDDYQSLSATVDSKTISVVKYVPQSHIWVTAIGDSANARQITSSPGVVESTVAWTPDNSKIVYCSNAGGNDDIWITNADGSDNPKQLTSNARLNRNVVASPDGKSIVFLSDRTGTPHLWKMNLDGSSPQQLTHGELGEQSPQFSPDSKWIVYSTAQNEKRTSWRIASDGSGAPISISDKQSWQPTISPDGGFVGYLYKERDDAPWRIGVSELESQQFVKTFDLPPTFGRPLRWTADGRYLVYVDTRNGVSNLVGQPLAGGPMKQLTDFKSDHIFWFDFSHDGKQLAVSRGTENRDVQLISGY